MTVVRYLTPQRWLSYDVQRVFMPLSEAKAAVMSLANIPYQKAWAERLQEVQLKQEVAGTSRIEGAEFTENEFAAALSDDADESGMTRSQRQARAAVNTYRWISGLPTDRPIDSDLVLEIHRRIVTGCDDDHCEPGALRRDLQNVTFGRPPHRGAEGGAEVAQSFAGLIRALNTEFLEHDILIRALAFHYHIGAMHPFLDGNGRTARAVEALLLQRSGLKNALFIALSNYYYDEKQDYLKCLSAVRAGDGDLTDFLVFGLRGIALQANRLLKEINRNISKALFRDMATHLFTRMSSSRKRVIAKRQVTILNFLLDRGETELDDLFRQLKHVYEVQGPWGAFIRDIIGLQSLKAIRLRWPQAPGPNTPYTPPFVDVRLSWPTEITETKFFEKTKELPRAKTLAFLERDFSESEEAI